MKTELESGWFAILIEPDDKDDYGKNNLTKVCKLIKITTCQYACVTDRKIPSFNKNFVSQ